MPARLLGYVSDERYLTLSDVAVEISGDGEVWQSRSGPGGAIRADVPPGSYRVTLAKDGYGAKHVDADLGGEPYQFRLVSDQIFGYVWPKWTVSGELGEFRVHSPEPYRLSLRRYGAEAEPETLIGWYDEHAPRATVQVTPDGDYTQTGVHWNERGYVDPSHRQYVAAPDRGGLYYFHAVGESGAHFSFPWVIAPRAPRSDIAVLASTNTWNAYNNFGGRSNYINAVGLPPTPSLVPRLELTRYQESAFNEHAFPDDSYPPLSFERPEPLNQIGAGERPEDPIRGRQPCHLAPAEWRLISWLERNGYEHDLYSDAHLHDGTLDLSRYRVLVLSTHPEYWSRRMYDAVMSWVHDRGGKLAYLGGNGLDCEVEFVSPDALRFRTETVGNGERYESRMARSHLPTSALLGVVFTAAGAMTSAPYRVVDSSHWVFEGSGLRDGDVFGTASLHERCPGGASGHETDKTTRHTRPGAKVLARGTNRENGGAELVHFRAGEGEVFAAGSITWPASVLVDAGVSTVTSNVMDRFTGRSAGDEKG